MSLSHIKNILGYRCTLNHLLGTRQTIKSLAQEINCHSNSLRLLDWDSMALSTVPWQLCPTLTKGCKWQITQIWNSDGFTLDFYISTSSLSFEQKHSSCWKIFKSRHHDIALMSMYVTDTFCSYTRNFIFKRWVLLSEEGRAHLLIQLLSSQLYY